MLKCKCLDQVLQALLQLSLPISPLAGTTPQHTFSVPFHLDYSFNVPQHSKVTPTLFSPLRPLIPAVLQDEAPVPPSILCHILIHYKLTKLQLIT